MDNEPEVIRQQMQETRTSLTEKLETLEQQVVGTVQSAKTAVTETVENVKGAVQETVQSVKNTVDLPLQVRRHPWAMVGGSLAAGCLAGYLLTEPRRPPSFHALSAASHSDVPWPHPHPNGGTRGRHAAEPSAMREPSHEAQAPSSGPSWLGELKHTFRNEIQQVEGLALATLLGALRDVVTRNVPEKIAPQVSEIIDNVTAKLGGKPIRGSVLDPHFAQRTTASGVSG
jgi:ElaB/YqjD/DUF883 family membrane-anchored ribosome-binding protein